MLNFLQKFACFGPDVKKKENYGKNSTTGKPFCKRCETFFQTRERFQKHLEVCSGYSTRRVSEPGFQLHQKKPTLCRSEAQSPSPLTVTSPKVESALPKLIVASVDEETAEMNEMDKIAIKNINQIEGLSNPRKLQFELQFIDSNFERITPNMYAVDSEWIENYANFLHQKIIKPPEPLDNSKVILDIQNTGGKPNYYRVNELVWKFILRKYKASPEIKLSSEDDSDNKSEMRSEYINRSDERSDAKTTDTVSKKTSIVTITNVYSEKSQFLQPMGLINEYYFCYMNASLQCLLSINTLAQYFGSEKLASIIPKRSNRFTKAFNELILAHNRRYISYNPKLMKKICQVLFNWEEQHDSHEFLRFLLAGLQEEINGPFPKTKKETSCVDPETAWLYYKKYNISVIDDAFAGQIISRVLCKNCSFTSATYDPVLDLQLPIISGKTSTLDDCLMNFFQEEELVDTYQCEKCNNKSRAKKKMTFNKFPKILVIQLKRFKVFPRKKKITDFIQYPLDSLKINKISETQADMITYNLFGIVVHSGGVNSGHYICYAKRGENWYLFDDHIVQQIEPKNVLNKEAYILFYQKDN